MEKFTASNEVTVEFIGDRISVGCSGDATKGHDLSVSETEAAREFFQAERDEELGRWRWPENPDYVVYLAADGQAIVIDERTGIHVYRYRGEAAEMRRMRAGTGEDIMLATKAAEVYFEAHPEPKPWHDAKPGEVWVIEQANTATTAARAVMFNERMTFEPVDNITRHIDVDDPIIVGGRRIWPEVSDD